MAKKKTEYCPKTQALWEMFNWHDEHTAMLVILREYLSNPNYTKFYAESMINRMISDQITNQYDMMNTAKIEIGVSDE